MSDDLGLLKKKFRAELRRTWSSIGAAELERLSRAVCERVEANPGWKKARSVLLYLPMAGELNVETLGKRALAQGKILTVPRVDWGTRSMAPARLECWPELTGASSGGTDRSERAAGAPAPPSEAPEFPAEELDLVIVPGLGFDVSGNRMGRGAGFYDRFLLHGRTSAALLRIGVAPEAAVCERVPHDATDAPVDLVVTEARVIEPRKSPGG